jgi:hypothetical protein
VKHDDAGSGLGPLGAAALPASLYAPQGAGRGARGVEAWFVAREPREAPATVAARLDLPRRVETDWLVVTGLPHLHLAALDVHQLHDLASDEIADAPHGRPHRLLCGRTTGTIAIPGALDRHEEGRCPDCCAKAGYPAGGKSPRHDPACRAVLARRLEGLA